MIFRMLMGFVTKLVAGSLAAGAIWSVPSLLRANWQAVYQETSSGVVYLFSNGQLCSGALISPDVVLTAWHCVSSLQPVTVGWQDLNIPEVSGYAVVRDVSHDVALVRLNSSVSRPVLPVLPATSAVKVGQEIGAIGHPMGVSLSGQRSLNQNLTYILSKGIVAKVNERSIVTDMSLSPGNSGGPVLDQEGRIVGVVSQKYLGTAVGSLGIIATHKHIQGLLQQVQPSTELAFYHAASSWQLSLGWYEEQNSKATDDDRAFGSQVEMTFNLFDRIALAYATGSSGEEDRGRFDQYSVGYRFHFDLSNAFTLKVVPKIGARTYRDAQVPDTGRQIVYAGAGLELLGSFLKLDYDRSLNSKVPVQRMSLGINLLGLF